METVLYDEMRDLESSHWWFVGRRTIIRSMLTDLFPQKAARGIDIGCGTGRNLELLRAFVERISGIDTSLHTVEIAQLKNQASILKRGTFPDVDERERYDLVTLFDVLEHLSDDRRRIQRIAEFLKPGGVAFLTVPAISFLWSEHDERFHHHRRYSKRALAELISYEPTLILERISYFNFFFFPVAFAVRLAKRAFRVRTGASDFFFPPPFLNSLGACVFGSEGFFLKFLNFPIGVSLVCILRKKT